ncbi:hypothetical protein [Paraburkholderia sp. USG1]|uniref:GAP1-N1 domain-containing protein n=1 Tax=Paraburkholderia sp. USG1 TaxID=2952268 RepID=UPI002870160C|nr:hypothetical protein [Paraburkholderia sp. USG1]
MALKLNLQKTVNADQALHGYRDGHKLLAASLQLDDFSLSTMARMSDMQPRSLTPSQSYICAYPLKNAKKYVVSRTWLAHEMRRPGCVWTHSLLLPYGTVAQIENINKIFDLLTRPQMESLRSYEQRLDMTDAVGRDTEVLTVGHDDNRRLHSVLSGLYCKNDSVPAFVSRSGSEKDETLVAAVWNQMPPRLRREFVFCTSGSAGTSLPDAALSLILSDEIDETAIESPPHTERHTVAIDEILDDVQSGRRSTLRAFLSRYVTDAQNPRTAIIPLTEIKRALTQSDFQASIQGAATLIGVAFGGSGDCQLLKKDLLTGQIFPDEALRSGAGLHNIVRCALPPMKTLRDFPDRNTIEEFSMMAQSDGALLQFVLDECMGCADETLGAQILTYLLEATPAETFATLNVSPATMYALAVRRPELFADPHFWNNASALPIDEILRTLEASGNTSHVVKGLLRARKYQAVQLLLTRNPAKLNAIVIDALESLGTTAMTEAIAKLRSGRLQLFEAMTNVSASAELIESFAGDVLEHYYPEPSARLWGNVLKTAHETWSGLQPYSLLAIFKSASHANLREAAPLYEISFQGLHNVVQTIHGRKEAEVRATVLREYQSLSYKIDSDAAERLRANMCRHYEYVGHPDERFFRCAKDGETVIELAQSMVQITGGRRWLHRLLQANDRGQLSLTAAEELAVESALARDDKNNRW